MVVRSTVLLAVVVACWVTGAGAATARPHPPKPVQPIGLSQVIDHVVPAAPVIAPRAVPAIATGPGIAPDLAALRLAVLPDAVGDPFFDEWPADLARHADGAVIAVRDITAAASPLLLWAARRVTQLKFRTTDAHGRPSFATATLVEPAAAWTGPGDRPVLVNNLAIDALGRTCTPSYTLAHGISSYSNLNDYLPPTTWLGELRDYAVLIPDHEGPRMAYAEPYVAGHAVLDSLRAVRAYAPGRFGRSPIAMTGYSGGAIATLAAARLLGGYAPELAGDVVGAAIGGVPADYRMLSQTMNGNLASGIYLAATLGVARERPEILGAMNHLAQWAAISPLKNQCTSVLEAGGVAQLPIDVAADIEDPLRSSLARRVFADTGMTGMRSGTPLLVYNGEQDWWVPAAGARALYAEQCALGVRAIYRGVLGEHFIASDTGYPEAVGWLDQRLRGVPAPTEC